MEGIRHRSALARFALAAFAAAIVAACASAPPPASKTPFPTLAPLITGSNPAFTPGASPSTSPTPAEVPDSPMTTKAVALQRPQRGSTAPVGAVVFGNDVIENGQRVTIDGERVQFPAGHDIAWRVTLPAAIGGESVRVTLSTEQNTETLVDEFVAQAGWNVYFGKSRLTVAPGTYVLHYLVDGHEVGSGTFKLKPGDGNDETTDSPPPTSTPS